MSHDPGDQHVDPPPPPPPSMLSRLIDELDIPELPETVFWLVYYHETMRSCCRHCALEVCGEDGS